MGKGWGYGKNTLSQGDILYNTAIKEQTERFTIYKGKVLYIGYINITILISNINNIKRVIMKYEGENKIQKIYDVSQCNNKKEICKYIDNVLLEQYFNDAYDLEMVSSK